MFFELSRILLLVLLIGIVLLATKGMKKWVPLLLCLLCIGIISLSSVWPPENLFIDFKTPEKALAYYAAGEFINGEIMDIEEGEQTCMLFYEESPNNYKQVIFPKTEAGYKLPCFYGEKTVAKKIDGSGFYKIHNYKGSDDYYLFAAFTTNKENITVTDSCGKQIDVIIKKNSKSENKTVFILSYIDEYTDDYSVTINDKTIKMNPNA